MRIVQVASSTHPLTLLINISVSIVNMCNCLVRDVFRTGGPHRRILLTRNDEIYIDLDVAHHRRRHYLVSFSIFSAVLPERQTALHVLPRNITCTSRFHQFLCDGFGCIYKPVLCYTLKSGTRFSLQNYRCDPFQKSKI